MSETRTVEFNGRMIQVEIFTHTCKVCERSYEDTLDEQYWCSDCDNEYAEWLDEMGYVVGEFDAYDHPNFVADPHAGTKWKKMEG